MHRKSVKIIQSERNIKEKKAKVVSYAKNPSIIMPDTSEYLG